MSAVAVAAAMALLRHHAFPATTATFPSPISNPTRFPLRTSLLTSPSNSHIFLAAARRRVGEDEEKEEELFDEDEEEEEEEMSMREMNEWLKKKPRGFGEGRNYDTSLEDKLLDEIEQSRKSQLANLNKLRNENESIKKKGEAAQKQIKATDVRTGIRVRISNLPRKKNIHRDLESAFKGLPGIINISPAVIGNEKTRDPICKGFAFVELDSEGAAERFVQTYSKESVVFGKVQKLITCTIIDHPQSHEISREVNREILNEEEDEILTEANDLPSQLEEESTTFKAVNGDNSFEDHSNSNNNISVPQKKKKGQISKKKTAKTKSQTSKLPASLARLKVRERAALTGVFAKYGAKSVTQDKDS